MVLIVVGTIFYGGSCLSEEYCEAGRLERNEVMGSVVDAETHDQWIRVGNGVNESCWAFVSSLSDYTNGSWIEVLHLRGGNRCSLQLESYRQQAILGIVCFSIVVAITMGCCVVCCLVRYVRWNKQEKEFDNFL
jgi:hypothetical protein